MQRLPDMDLLTLAPVLQGSKLSVKELAQDIAGITISL
jgi:hypothetical protein